MKHNKLLSGIIIAGLLVFVCFVGSAAADDPVLPEITLSADVGFTGDPLTLTMGAGDWIGITWYDGYTWPEEVVGTTNPCTYIPSTEGVGHSISAELTYPSGMYDSDTYYVYGPWYWAYQIPDISVSPVTGDDTTTVTLTPDYGASEGYLENTKWYVSKDGGAYTYIGQSDDSDPFLYKPRVTGTYAFRAVVEYFAYTETTPIVTVDIPQTVVIYPDSGASISPKVGKFSEYFNLNFDDATGSNYQWYVSSDNGISWMPMTGATSTSYSFRPCDEEWSLTWPPAITKFKVEYESGGVPQTVYVPDPVYILGDSELHMSADYIFLDDSITLSIGEASGFSTITWYADYGYGYEEIGNKQPITYTPRTSGTYNFKAVIEYNGLGYTDTLYSTIPLTVIWPATVGPNLGFMSNSFYLSIDAPTGSNYQWYVTDDDGATWTPITGATTAEYEFQPINESWATELYPAVYKYKVIYDDKGETRECNAIGETSFLEDIDISISSDYVHVGDTVTLSADAHRAATYSWYYYLDGEPMGLLGTGSTVTHTPTTTGTYTYYLNITIQDPLFGVSKNLGPVISVWPSSVGPDLGFLSGPFYLSIGTPSGTNFQWYVSGDDGATWIEMEGATTAEYEFHPINESWATELYPKTYKYKVVYEELGETRTDYPEQTTSFLEDPEVTVTPDYGSVGDNITVSVTAPRSTSYHWYKYKGEEYIGSEDTASFTFTPDEAGTYHFTVDIYYTDPPFMTDVRSNDIIIREGATISTNHGKMSDSYTLTGPGDGTNYQWYYSTDGGTTWGEMGATTSEYTFSPDDESWAQPYPAEFTFKVEYEYGGKTYSPRVPGKVIFVEDPSISVTPYYGAVGSTLTATATAPGAGLVTWYLYKNGSYYAALGTGNSVSYTFTEEGPYEFQAVITYGLLEHIETIEASIIIMPAATITPASGLMTDSFTLSAPDGSINHQWYYSADGGTTWTEIVEASSKRTYTFIPANTDWAVPYPGSMKFKVEYAYIWPITSIIPDTVYFYNVPQLSAAPLFGIPGDTITLTATNTGFDTIQWKVSKDGEEYTLLGTSNPQEHIPDEVGTYRYQAIIAYGGLTQTVTLHDPVVIKTPTITVSPKRGNLTSKITLTAKDVMDYTDFLWQVSKDGGAYTTVGTTNPYSYVPGEEGEYLYRVILSAEDKPDYTITADEPIEIIDGDLPGTAPISTAAFYVAAVFLILLFMAGLYFVYNDNIFGFIASGFSVLCSWALMALSAFGRVGDTHVFYSETTGEIVKQVLFVDPSMVFILTFACIIMTIVYIVILVRFIAQLALLRQRDPEEEEEE